MPPHQINGANVRIDLSSHAGGWTALQYDAAGISAASVGMDNGLRDGLWIAPGSKKKGLAIALIWDLTSATDPLKQTLHSIVVLDKERSSKEEKKHAFGGLARQLEQALRAGLTANDTDLHAALAAICQEKARGTAMSRYALGQVMHHVLRSAISDDDVLRHRDVTIAAPSKSMSAAATSLAAQLRAPLNAMDQELASEGDVAGLVSACRSSMQFLLSAHAPRTGVLLTRLLCAADCRVPQSTLEHSRRRAMSAWETRFDAEAIEHFALPSSF